MIESLEVRLEGPGLVEPVRSGAAATGFAVSPTAALAPKAAVLFLLCQRRSVPQAIALVEGILEVPFFTIEDASVAVSPQIDTVVNVTPTFY